MADDSHIYYVQGQELPSIGRAWYVDGSTTTLRNLSTGYTFTVQIGIGSTAYIVKTAGITGYNASTNPNVVIAFDPGELDGLEPGTYTLRLIARDGSGRDDVCRPDLTLHVERGMTSGGSLAPIAGGPLNLLSDVAITSAASGQILYHNGTEWVNGYSGFADGQRIRLSTSSETSGSFDNELIRLVAETQSAKATLAYQNYLDETEAWLQWHYYLHLYRTYSFAAASVDLTNDRIAVASLTTVTGVSEWRTTEKVVLTTTGTAPTGLTAGSTYYVRTSGGFVTFHATEADADAGTNKINLTGQGTGTHTITPDLAYRNNEHRHLSVELKRSDGSLQTSLSFPTGFDWPQISTFQADFNICDNGKFRILGEQGGHKQFVFGNTPNDNLVHDGQSYRWVMRQNIEAESGGNVGSNLQFVRLSDTGVALDTVVHMARGTGFVGIAGNTAPAVALDVGGVGTTAMRVGRANNSSQFCSYELATAATAYWALQMRNVSNNDAYMRDVINGRSIWIARQTGQFGLANGLEITRREIADTSITASVLDIVIAYTSLTATRTVTLPNTATSGQIFWIVDEAGTANVNPIVLDPSGATLINGAATYSINTARGGAVVQFNGSSYSTIMKW